jgi:hypothetical protein
MDWSPSAIEKKLQEFEGALDGYALEEPFRRARQLAKLEDDWLDPGILQSFVVNVIRLSTELMPLTILRGQHTMNKLDRLLTSVFVACLTGWRLGYASHV